MNEMENALMKMQTQAETRLLAKCNEYSAHYGLVLSQQDMQRLEKDRFEALARCERVEFGTGILPSLIYAFSDSPYVDRKSFTDTLSDLQDIFYEAKSICGNIVSDEELVGYMKKKFNGKAQGSCELLSAYVEALCTVSVQNGRSAASGCEIDDYAYINHNSEDEGFEKQVYGGDDD